MRHVRQEQTHWRDAALSLRHRQWGADLAAVDLDLVLVEFDHGTPRALIEYKSAGAQVDFSSPSVKALERLATAAGIPFAVVKYWPDTWAFAITPMNAAARRAFKAGECTEVGFVRQLYELRGRVMPVRIAEALSCELPPLNPGVSEPSPIDLDGDCEVW